MNNQNQMSDDLKNIRREEKVIIAAEKSINKAEKNQYKEYLLHKITKDHKKVEKNVIDNIKKRRRK